MDRIERRLDATTKLLQHGMKMLAKFQDENRRAQEENRKEQEENRHAIRALIDAQQRAEIRQRRTEAQLDKLIVALLKNNPNGTLAFLRPVSYGWALAAESFD